ncbi:hypothetical protein CYMTET_39803 [Cymbomonas tetramitiformis]|uniref:Nucleotide-diphospho-sugar transferase domain-containing protein n=1 Tax=Cymbomonas tetramitiformis TaxID=36881 RepID=A0AAE0F3L7_9CHLO|nr:hypothetical protein CYMTET_39803 [Cymbomonas tetramitiformis]
MIDESDDVAGDAHRWRTKNYVKLVSQRAMILKRIVEMGIDVLYADTDITWYKNPWEHVFGSGERNFYVQQEKSEVVGDYNCSGFLFIRASALMRPLCRNPLPVGALKPFPVAPCRPFQVGAAETLPGWDAQKPFSYCFANKPQDIKGYHGGAAHSTFAIPFKDETKVAYRRPREYSPGGQEIIDLHCTVVRSDVDANEEGESREVSLDEKAIAMGYNASELRMTGGVSDEELAGILGLAMDSRAMELLFSVAEASTTGLPRSEESQEVEHDALTTVPTGRRHRQGGQATLPGNISNFYVVRPTLKISIGQVSAIPAKI